MSSAPTSADIARDATWLVQALDAKAGVARVVRMDPQAYRDASFLDDRMLQGQPEAHIVPWQVVRDCVRPEARGDARWIFHIGHVGSTLIARLLGELHGILSIREPRFLRDVAMLRSPEQSEFTAVSAQLFSRTFESGETALVKATSFVSEIADALIPAEGHALFLYATPRNYIASILAGPNSVQELAALEPSRRERMKGRVVFPAARNPAEAAAAAWACEMTSLEAACFRMASPNILWANFDAMLADMPGELDRLARSFQFDTKGLAAIAAGPLMGRYSKATEYEYTPALRRDLIAEACAANRADIDRAIAMLQSAAQTSPMLDHALRRTGCTEPSKS